MRKLVNDDQTLVCRIQGGMCALPLTHVVETLRPLPAEPIAGAPAFVAGVAVIRGAAVPVVDAARLLNGGDGRLAGSDHRGRRYVLLDTGTRPVALAVDEVIGVRSISTAARGELPPLLATAAAEVIASVGALDSDLLLVLQAGRVLPEGIALP